MGVRYCFWDHHLFIYLFICLFIYLLMKRYNIYNVLFIKCIPYSHQNSLPLYFAPFNFRPFDGSKV